MHYVALHCWGEMQERVKKNKYYPLYYFYRNLFFLIPPIRDRGFLMNEACLGARMIIKKEKQKWGNKVEVFFTLTS